MTHSYKGIAFFVGPNSATFGNELPSQASRWMHWSRFFEQYEIKELYESSVPIEQKVKIMKRAIDRALSDSPCFSGDIRDQMIPGKY